MSPGLTTGLGPWVVAAALLLLLAAIVALLRAYREWRFAPFYLLRQRAARRARARGVLVLGLFVTTAGLAVYFARFPPVPLPIPTLPSLPVLIGLVEPTATQGPARPTAPPSTRAPTPSPTVTASLVAPPTRMVSSPVLTPSATSGDQLPVNLLTPVTPRASPAAGADFGPILVASQVSTRGVPLVVTDTFRTGRFTIYAVFTYTQMTPGVMWAHVWMRGETFVRGEIKLWGGRASGRTYVYVNPREGWAPGDYEVRLFLGERLVRRGRFRVLP